MNRQTTNAFLMVEPVAFGYNDQTAVNNFFMKTDTELSEQEIQFRALQEFNSMVSKLRDKQINVIVVKDTNEPRTPDSIFPNNWISFHEKIRLAKYPMFAPNRRLERRDDIIKIVENAGFAYSQIVDYSIYEKENKYLEGSGSMVFDRGNRIAYAAISDRTNPTLFKWFCGDFGYKPISFKAYQTVDGKRLPVYHTNVMLSIADKYAIACFECIDDGDERTLVTDSIKESGKMIIEITEKQMHHFAGNMLQVENETGEKFLLMSGSAYESLNKLQVSTLETYNQLIVVDIPTIEKYGGGSVRCMMAEIF